MIAEASDGLAALRSEHARLLRQDPEPGDLQRLMDRVAAAGASTGDAEARRALQSLLTYWTAHAIRRGLCRIDALPRLAPHDSAAASADAPRPDPPAAPPNPRDVAEARDRLRLAVQAGEWRDAVKTGQPGAGRGYLLNGRALDQARRVAGDHPEVAALIAASAQEIARRQRGAMLAAVLVALAVAAAVWVAWERQQRKLSDAEAAAFRLRADDLERENREAAARLADTTQRLAAAEAQLARQAQATPPIAAATPDAEAPRTAPPADFLGQTVQAPTWPEDGRPPDTWDFGTFSLSQRPGSRMADAAFVVIDRGRRAGLDPVDAAAVIRGLRQPPYLPPDRLPDPARFRAPGVLALFLVTPDEVAWGEEFPPPPPDASAEAAAAHRRALTDRALGRVAMLPNALPVPGRVPVALWESVNAHALTVFAAGEPRVVALSGPLKGPEEEILGLWKVMVAPDPDRRTPLRVEAFLVEPGLPPGAGAEAARVRLADLERRAGIDFGAELRAQDAAPAATPDRGGPAPLGPDGADALIGRLPALDAATVGDRTAAYQALLAGFGRDGALASATDRERVLRAMLARSTPEAFDGQSPDGRYNLALLWSALPADLWTDPELAGTRADARHALRLLRDSGAAGRFGSFARTDEKLGQAIAAMAAGLSAGRRVFVQFAGYPRPEVQALTAPLRALGWTVPGEERIGSAEGQNELRFNPDDAATAALLVGDLARLHPVPIRLRPTRIVPKGSPELWISPPPR